MECSGPVLIILKQYKSIESKPPSRFFCLTWTPSCLALIPLDLHFLLDLLEPPGGHKKTVVGIACKTRYEKINSVVKNLLADLVLRQSQEVIDGAVQIFISTIPKTRQKPGKQACLACDPKQNCSNLREAWTKVEWKSITLSTQSINTVFENTANSSVCRPSQKTM